MSVRRIVLEVDPAAFFDAVSEHGLIASQCPIGSRVIACLLGGADWRERAGLQFYGISATEEPQP